MCHFWEGYQYDSKKSETSLQTNEEKEQLVTDMVEEEKTFQTQTP